MSNADEERWNRRYLPYLNGEKSCAFTPDTLLTEHAALFSGEGAALDLACGSGANALWLASRGYQTSALDASSVALDLLQTEASRRDLEINTIHATSETWQWPEAHFSAITMFRYLDRKIFDAIDRALAPGGLLVYQTFNANHLEQRPDFNPDYVLGMNELNDAFSSLEVIVNDQTGTSTRFIARRAL